MGADDYGLTIDFDDKAKAMQFFDSLVTRAPVSPELCIQLGMETF